MIEDTHTIELTAAELDLLQDAIAYWLAEYLIRGKQKPDAFAMMATIGNKAGMHL